MTGASWSGTVHAGKWHSGISRLGNDGPWHFRPGRIH